MCKSGMIIAQEYGQSPIANSIWEDQQKESQMFKRGLVLATILVMATAATASAGITQISVLEAGDGYWHNASGTSSDYFDSNSNSVEARYVYNDWFQPPTVYTRTGYMQFGLNIAPTVSEIDSVSLHAYFNSSTLNGPGSYAGNVYHRSDASTATGQASQKLSGDQLVTTVDPGMSGWNSVDVTDFIMSDLTNGYNWSVFSFRPEVTDSKSNSGTGFSLASAESDYGAYLRIVTGEGNGDDDPNAVPEPGTLALFGLGSAGLALMRRKQI